MSKKKKIPSEQENKTKRSSNTGKKAREASCFIRTKGMGRGRGKENKRDRTQKWVFEKRNWETEFFRDQRGSRFFGQEQGETSGVASYQNGAKRDGVTTEGREYEEKSSVQAQLALTRHTKNRKLRGGRGLNSKFFGNRGIVKRLGDEIEGGGNEGLKI